MFLSSGGQGKAQKKARSHLAVGTAAGDVKLYDTKLGALKWRVSSCVDG